jgi:hypothetical protein
MQKNTKSSEKNIKKLLTAGFSEEYHLDEHLKRETLDLLLQNVDKRKKTARSECKILVGLFATWIAFAILIFSGSGTSFYMLDLIKPVFVLSLVFIPFSSIILIILKKRTHEKKLV